MLNLLHQNKILHPQSKILLPVSGEPFGQSSISTSDHFWSVLLFFWARLYFNPAFLIILRTVTVLIDGGIPALTITLFTLKFLTSCSTLALRKMFRFCLSENFCWSALILFSFIRNQITNVFYHVSANCDLRIIFHVISSLIFPTKFFSYFDVDNASELLPLVGLFVKFSSLISSFSFWFSMHLKKRFLINI